MAERQKPVVVVKVLTLGGREGDFGGYIGDEGIHYHKEGANLQEVIDLLTKAGFQKGTAPPS